MALVAWGFAMARGIPALFCLATTLVLVGEHLRWRGEDGPTRADKITFARLALCTLLGVPALFFAPIWAVGIGWSVLILDAVDGRVARREGTAGPAGAWLDMESDAILITTASLNAYAWLDVPAWILLCGLARYLYVVTLWRWPAHGHIPRARWGRISFGLGAALLVSLPLLPPSWRNLAAALVFANTTWSFGRSFWWSYARPTLP